MRHRPRLLQLNHGRPHGGSRRGAELGIETSSVLARPTGAAVMTERAALAARTPDDPLGVASRRPRPARYAHDVWAPFGWRWSGAVAGGATRTTPATRLPRPPDTKGGPARRVVPLERPGRAAGHRRPVRTAYPACRP